MSDSSESASQSDDQRRDALLLKLLKTPPQPRPKRVRDRGEVKDERPSSRP